MAEKLCHVPMSEMVASANIDDVLVVYGVGSCVVVCLHDPVARVGGMLHALLPGAAWNNKPSGKPTKFADQGVSLLINALVALGARQTRLRAQICGGARMINSPAFNGALKIGERNVLAAQMALQATSLDITAQDTGGQHGRTVKLHIATGQVTVRRLGQQEIVITNHHQ
jgi:chemotaxis protein CheD